MKFIFTACNENSSLQCRNPEIKLRDGDDQRPQLYFKLYFLTATSLFLKGLLALIKILITPGRYSKITLHLLFSVHTGSNAEAVIEENTDDINTRLVSP